METRFVTRSKDSIILSFYLCMNVHSKTRLLFKKNIMQTFNFISVIILSTIVATCFAVIPCIPIKYRECPGVPPKAELVNVYVVGCTDEPCDFAKGKNASVEFDIRFNEPVTTLKAEVYAVVFGAEIKWDGVNPEACQNFVSEKDCPFKKDDYATYGADLFVNPSYPSVSADVKYILKDGNGDIQICWQLSVQVV